MLVSKPNYSSDTPSRGSKVALMYEKTTGTWGLPASQPSSETNLTFDGSTGKWVSNPVNQQPTDSDSSNEESTPTPTPKDSATSVDSKSQAEKEYIEIELNTLTGELTLIPSKKSVRIKQNNTVEILGVGKYLSGKYFVSNVKRTLSRDGGYSQTLTVMKNGFGDTLKSGSESTSTEKETDREVKVEKTSTDFKVGDSVKIVGADAIYSNADEGVKVPAWVKQKTLTIRQISSDGTRVLLMPILSWTYVKYVQKV